jgi:hypothetical protein
MKTHIKIVAILHIIFGAMSLIGAVVIITVFGVAGGIAASQGEPGAAGIVGIVGLLIAGMLALISLPGIIGGVGLLGERNWARILVMIVGILHLFNFPIGTALGIYTLWALLSHEVPPVSYRQESVG